MTGRRAALAVTAAAGAMLSACSERQSALAPAGGDADAVYTLTLVLFIGAAVIQALIVGGIWIALRGSVRSRALLADRRSIWIGGLILPCIVLTALLAHALWLMRATVAEGARPPDLIVEVVGEQWWWRVTYRLPDGRAVSEANEIRLPAGRGVEFRLTSADVIHSFWIPSLGGKMDMIPGRTNRLRLTAVRPGIHRGQCAEYCGGPHALMAKDVVVMTPVDFEAWMSAATPAPPTADEERQGLALFLAAGCGACHAVRGTTADGTIGPDLSRFGGRATIAAGAVRNTPAELARFIAAPHDVKPGSLMPAFAFLSRAERHAIALYLTGLK